METSQRSFLAFLRPNNETVAVPERHVASLGFSLGNKQIAIMPIYVITFLHLIRSERSDFACCIRTQSRN